MSGKRCALEQKLVGTWRSELSAGSKHTRSAASATCRAVLMLLMLLATCSHYAVRLPEAMRIAGLNFLWLLSQHGILFVLFRTAWLSTVGCIAYDCV